jgi:hypothetical protein
VSEVAASVGFIGLGAAQPADAPARTAAER